jgi:hypothetical protein
MENGHLHDDKLFRTVHDRLSDYEAPSEGANWDAMSRALDNLPKSSGLRWKISLNSILLIVGILGISAISYAVASHTGNTADKKTTAPEAPVVKQETNTNPVVPVSNPAPSNIMQNTVTDPNALANNNATGQEMQANIPAAEDALLPNTNPDGTKKHRKNQLVFGDQIDPKKGFIYGTHESPAITSAGIVDPSPNVFYDADQNGNVKKIIISKKDSASKGSSHKADSTAKTSKPAGAPTDSEQTGFDTQDN